MMDHSFQQTHNLTISKASDRLKYLFSIGWLDQNGMFSEYGPDNYDRINLRSNISVELIKDKLSLDSRISYSRGVNLYHAAEGYGRFLISPLYKRVPICLFMIPTEIIRGIVCN